MGFARWGYGLRVRDAVGCRVGCERRVRGDELASMRVDGLEAGLVPVQNGAGCAVVHDVEVDHDGQVGIVGENVGCTGEKARGGGDFGCEKGNSRGHDLSVMGEGHAEIRRYGGGETLGGLGHSSWNEGDG